MTEPFPASLLNELVDDFAAAAEIVNGNVRRLQADAARWTPQPCPSVWRPHPGDPHLRDVNR